jgi:hypothetical protein
VIAMYTAVDLGLAPELLDAVQFAVVPRIEDDPAEKFIEIWWLYNYVTKLLSPNFSVEPTRFNDLL